MSKDKKSGNHAIDFIFILALLGVFTASALVVVFIGSNVYKATAQNMEDSFTSRTALSFVMKQVRQCDTVDAVSVGTVEGENALILKENTENGVRYKYIYYYDEFLRELYTEADFIPTLSSGQQLVQIGGFEASENSDGTITISVDNLSGDSATVTMALQSRS